MTCASHWQFFFNYVLAQNPAWYRGPVGTRGRVGQWWRLHSGGVAGLIMAIDDCRPVPGVHVGQMLLVPFWR